LNGRHFAAQERAAGKIRGNLHNDAGFYSTPQEGGPKDSIEFAAHHSDTGSAGDDPAYRDDAIEDRPIEKEEAGCSSIPTRITSVIAWLPVE
jgi:hypothetical protein